MALIGTPRSFHDKHRFLIEIPGFCYTGFQKCSELKASVSVREHYEGGTSMAHKGPGKLKVADITLERGATNDLDLYNWFSQVSLMATGTGQPEPHFKRDLSIVQLGRSGTPRIRWHVYGAFPIEFVAGDWDSSSDEIVISKITLAVDYFEAQTESDEDAQETR